MSNAYRDWQIENGNEVVRLEQENEALREALAEVAATGMRKYCASCGESSRIAKQALIKACGKEQG